MDISNLLGNAGIELERSAFSKLGAAVEDFTRQSGQAAPFSQTQQTINSSTYNASNQSINGTRSEGEYLGPAGTTSWTSVQYAEDLISLAPKHKFLFKVHFHFNQPYVGDRDSGVFAYLVKSMSKPRLMLEYADVNMYNFRTKVLTNIKHDPVTMAFYDDIGNNVQEFFNTYRRAYSPISRTKSESSNTIFETSGMNFASPDSATVTGGEYAASLGQLNDGAINILHYIELEQYFGHGTSKNVFKFINPRIESFDFDDATMEGADLSEMKVTFNYDALIITTEKSDQEVKGIFGTHDIMTDTMPWSEGVSLPQSNIIGPSVTSVNSAVNSNYTQTSQNNQNYGNVGGSFQNGGSGIFSPGAITGMISDAAYHGIGSVIDREKSILMANATRTLFGAASKIGQSVAGTIAGSISNVSNSTVQNIRGGLDDSAIQQQYDNIDQYNSNDSTPEDQYDF